jgi:peptidoglycan hydrolase-like protein with peptidoglycan-binding domain
MSRRFKLRAIGAIVVAAVVVGAVAIFTTQSKGNSKRVSVGAPTAVVTRRDLSNTQDLDATLGFGDDRTVVARVAGIVTDVPSAGAVLRRGQELYALDGSPVFLLDGKQPAWRDFEEGMSSGADVRQLEANLKALGFDPGHLINIDGRFTAVTRAAVEMLQRRLRLSVTGTLPLGSVVFLPGERRIGAVFVHAGDAVAAGAQVLTSASTAQVATITLDTSQRSLISVGDRVQVILPDGRLTAGTISSVGATASQAQSDGDTSSSTISVEVAIPAHLTEPDGAPVTVRVTTETHRNVLSVPITSVLATSGGRRSLEVVALNGSTHLLPIKTGIYDGGFVEVSGSGVRSGVRVLDAPSS